MKLQRFGVHEGTGGAGNEHIEELESLGLEIIRRARRIQALQPPSTSS